MTWEALGTGNSENCNVLLAIQGSPTRSKLEVQPPPSSGNFRSRTPGELIAIFDGRHAIEWMVLSIRCGRSGCTTCLAHIVKTGEQALVGHLLAVGTTEPCDVCILIGLCGLDLLDCHPIRLRPSSEGVSQELRTLVCAQNLRQRSLLADLFEDADQPLRDDRGIDFGMHDLPVQGVDDVEARKLRPQASASSIKSADQTVSGERLMLLKS